jgi:Pentapeptide repeats (8 copies)
MANPEHLEILKQGVERWNEWRNYEPDVDPDLTAERLSSRVLIGANLSQTNLSQSDLSWANLRGANLTRRISAARFYREPSSTERFSFVQT